MVFISNEEIEFHLKVQIFLLIHESPQPPLTRGRVVDGFYFKRRN
jgi:hypothetical protein